MSDSNKTGPTAIPPYGSAKAEPAEPSTSKDVFGQLLAIIGLYVSVIAFGALIFSLINLYFPDVLNYDYGQFARGSLRWPLAILVIVFPLFIWWNSFLQKDLEKNPEKKELRSRKWFLHFTLFAAAIVIVGDLVSLIFRFLNGDLTVQFVLKILAVFLIASAVFIYYLWNIRKSAPAMRHPKMRWFVRGVVVFAAFFIVFGFFNAGSPFSERERRFDERRLQDLQSIQNEVINYWQAKEILPQNLDQLRSSVRGFSPAKDPETGESYIYKTLGPLEFELCAVFKTSNKESLVKGEVKPMPAFPRGVYYQNYYPGLDENWLHEAGKACFSRTIDPDLFPPLEKAR